MSLSPVIGHSFSHVQAADSQFVDLDDAESGAPDRQAADDEAAEGECANRNRSDGESSDCEAANTLGLDGLGADRLRADRRHRRASRGQVFLHGFHHMALQDRGRCRIQRDA